MVGDPLVTRAGITMSERELQREVLQRARALGWLCAHFHDSRRQIVKDGRVCLIGDADAAGAPDLLMVRDGHMIVAELKAERGRLRPEQERWLAALAEVPDITAAIWRPRDWHSGAIEAMLRYAPSAPRERFARRMGGVGLESGD